MALNLNEFSVNISIDVIVSGRYYVRIPYGSGEKIMCLMHPAGRERIYSEFLYNTAYDDAISSGLFSTEDLEELIKKRGLITKEEEEQEKELVKKIKGQETLFAKMRFAKSKKEKVGRNIEKLKSELAQIRNKLNSFYSLTAESIATETKVNYLCWASCYKEFEDLKFWATCKDFDFEKDLEFRSKVLSSVISFLVGFSEKSLRKLARHPEWRIRYIASMKTHFPLFSRMPEDYTRDQISLIYWSSFYQNIYEMMPEDRPTDDIIENDLLLDVYMEEYYKELEQERLVSRSKSKGTDAFDKEEVIVTRFNELYEQLEYDVPKESRKKGITTDLTIKRNKK